MRKFVGGIAVALAAVVGSAEAAETSGAIVDHFTVENVSAALTALGATDIKTYDAPGNNKGVSAIVAGQQLHMSIQHCSEPPGCRGLLIGAAFSTEGREVSAETLLTFTRRYPPTPATRLGDGAGISILRAVIADGGITTKNLQANIAMLAGTIPAFVKHVTEANVASAPNGTTALMRSGAQLRPIPLTPADMQGWELPPKQVR